MPTKRLSPDSRFQPLVDFYFAEFERRHGAKPVWDGSDGSALGRILYSQKQLSLEKLKRLLEEAFAWCDAWWGAVRRGDFCPLQPGFRMREFCAHFPKVAVRTARPAGAMPGVTADAIARVFREYQDRVIGSHDKRAQWDSILQRTLGLSYAQACHILAQEPMRPNRTGD